MDTRKAAYLGIRRVTLVALLLGLAMWPGLSRGRTSKIAVAQEARGGFARVMRAPAWSFDPSAVAVNAADDIFVATGAGCGEREAAGIFRSSDGGDSWTQINNGLTSTNARALTIAPSGAIFTGTADGVFRSTDNGDTWVAAGLRGVSISAMAASPSAIFASDGCFCSGVYRSTDGGASWIQVNAGLSACVNSIATDNTGGVFATTAGTGFYRSADNGGTWTPSNTGLTTLNLQTVAVNEQGDVFLGSASDGVFRSTDRGATWAVTGLQGIDVKTLSVSSTGEIFAGAEQSVYRSADSGETWTGLPLYVTERAAVTSLAFNRSGIGFATAGRGLLHTASVTQCGVNSTLQSKFSDKSIGEGNYIWFSSVLDVSGLGTSPTTIHFDQSTITFAANGTNYTLTVPSAMVTFNPNATTATNTFNTALNRWETTVPSSLTGKTFLTGLPFRVPAGGLPKNLNPVSWSGVFTSSSPVTVDWQWAAAVYTRFSDNYNAIGVKPVDDNHTSQYRNSDHAATPENFKPFLISGAKSGGGSSYTGDSDGTGHVASCPPPPTATPTPTPTATPTKPPTARPTMPWLRQPNTEAITGCTTAASTIASNFNGTPIGEGSYIWFNSVLNVNGSSAMTINFDQSTITFAANGTNYTLTVPSARVTFDPGATSSTTTFNTAMNRWETTVPSSGLSGNTFLAALSFPVPAGGLPGGINPVSWSGVFTSSSPVNLQWQWAAAVYSSLGDYNALGVKQVDDNHVGPYRNSDHAGTPENFKAFVTGGSRGGGGGDYTGSYSATASATACVPAPTAIPPTQIATQVAGGNPPPTSTPTPTMQPTRRPTMPWLRMQPNTEAITGCTTAASTIASNFNGTKIGEDNYIWFNSYLYVTGLGSSPTTIYFDQATITFAVKNTNYNLAVPSAMVTFDPSATTATTTFNTVLNRWETTAPRPGYLQNTFMTGLSFPVPAGGLPGGINPVTMSGVFTSSSPIAFTWQWSAAVYTSLTNDYNALGVQPVDINHGDEAGTPEHFKPYVIGGSRGGGGSNFTGSYSATGHVTSCIATPTPVPTQVSGGNPPPTATPTPTPTMEPTPRPTMPWLRQQPNTR